MKVHVDVMIGRDRLTAQKVKFLVKEDSVYTVIPKSLANELKIEEVSSITAKRKNEEVEAGLSIACLGLMGRYGFLPVIILDIPEPILGTSTLNALGLKFARACFGLLYELTFGTIVGPSFGRRPN